MDGCDRSGGGGFDDGCARANTGDFRILVTARVFIHRLGDVGDVLAESREQSERDGGDHCDGMPRGRRADERFVGRFVNNRYDRHTKQCIGFLHPA